MRESVCVCEREIVSVYVRERYREIMKYRDFVTYILHIDHEGVRGCVCVRARESV